MFPSIYDESQYRISTIRYILTVTLTHTDPGDTLCCTSHIMSSPSMTYLHPQYIPLDTISGNPPHIISLISYPPYHDIPSTYPPQYILPISLYNISSSSPLLHHTLSDIRLCGMTEDARIPHNISSPHIIPKNPLCPLHTLTPIPGILYAAPIISYPLPILRHPPA